MYRHCESLNPFLTDIQVLWTWMSDPEGWDVLILQNTKQPLVAQGICLAGGKIAILAEARPAPTTASSTFWIFPSRALFTRLFFLPTQGEGHWPRHFPDLVPTQSTTPGGWGRFWPTQDSKPYPVLIRVPKKLKCLTHQTPGVVCICQFFPKVVPAHLGTPFSVD